MKISKLKLKNIKCFKDVEISFENEDNHRIKNWSLIAGDNGQGKTTILRSIAAGLCDSRGASALLSELGDFIAQDKEEGRIEITLKDNQNDEGEKVTTIIQPEFIEQKGEIDRTKLFAVAYGAGRDVIGAEPYKEYALIDSVYSLFNYRCELQSAEVGAWRIKNKRQWPKLKSILKEVLMLDKPGDDISLGDSGLCVKSKWREVHLPDLSDGYQALFTVILDFLSWKLLSIDDDKFNLEELSGIFIMDEIEQHLHPRWQRGIIRILAEQFPNIQFICSTHTPICVLGLSDLKCESQLVKVGYVNGYSEAEIFDLKEEYRGYRYDQILSSDIFNLSGTRSASIEKKLKEYRDIYIKDEDKRNNKEKKRLKDIKDELKDLPMWDNMEDIETRRELIALLKSKKEGGKENDKD